MAILLFRPAAKARKEMNALVFQSPWWRFFFLDVWNNGSRKGWTEKVSVTLVAILLFRPGQENRRVGADRRFSRLGGDSSF